MNIHTLYFSATDTTKKVVVGIADRIGKKMGEHVTVNTIDFTLPGARKNAVSFEKDDLVIVGVPVYAGRVPNVLVKYLNTITGNGARAVAVVVFGNRAYDDALIELSDILASNGFTVIAGGAFIGEHSFSQTLGANRPDERDMALARDFADRIYAKIHAHTEFRPVAVTGNRPYRKYYVPRNEQGEPVTSFRLITPKTSDDCLDCKLCASVCPMGSIDFDDVSVINGICIKCCACVKKCPAQAKYFDDPNFLRHKEELEIAYATRSEPELFV